MQHIETRTELIDFICENIGQDAIVRACHYSTEAVQVMGGFSRIPPSPMSGWIVEITSVFDRTWLVAVVVDKHLPIFRVRIVESIPWQFYIGRSDRGNDSIYDGDNSQQACLARERSNDRK